MIQEYFKGIVEILEFLSNILYCLQCASGIFHSFARSFHSGPTFLNQLFRFCTTLLISFAFFIPLSLTLLLFTFLFFQIFLDPSFDSQFPFLFYDTYTFWFFFCRIWWMWWGRWLCICTLVSSCTILFLFHIHLYNTQN